MARAAAGCRVFADFCLGELSPGRRCRHRAVAAAHLQGCDQGRAASAGHARCLAARVAQRELVRRLAHGSRIAALYAVQAEAYGILELDANARSAAEKGLALVPSERDPVHLELLMAYVNCRLRQRRHRRRHPDHRGGARRAAVRLAGRYVPAHQPRAARAPSRARGSRHRHPDAGLSCERQQRALMAETHIMAADMLSIVMRSMGDYSQALALNQEKIDWDSEHGAIHVALRIALHARSNPEADGQLRWRDRRVREGAHLQRVLGRSARHRVRRSAHLRGAHRARAARARAARMLQRAAHFRRGAIHRFAQGDPSPAGAHLPGLRACGPRARDHEPGTRSRRRRRVSAHRRLDVRVACAGECGAPQLQGRLRRPAGICQPLHGRDQRRAHPSGRCSAGPIRDRPRNRAQLLTQARAREHPGAVESPGTAAALEYRGCGRGYLDHRAAHLFLGRQPQLPRCSSCSSRARMP